MTGSEGLSDGQLRLMSAFLYEEYIVVTHTAQNPKGVGRPAFCHYFDCHRREIPATVFESFVFPMTAVHCPRRAGAQYMSLTFAENETAQEPVPLINRAFKHPQHEVGVCVGQIYGAEKKWLEIIEFVEHHKMMGATMFYFTILEMDTYSKRTIEDYQRLGEIEATFVNTEYEKINWLFHMIQIHECFFRSKFHSKWVINIDIDERLTMTQMPLLSYLRQQPPGTCEIDFGSRRVQKVGTDPEHYQSDAQILSEMAFLRYNVTTTHQWGAFKAIFRPDKVHMIFFHWTWRQQDGCVIKTAERRVGYVRHYRTISEQSLAGNWVQKIKPYQITRIDSQFAEKLREKVLRRVKFLYELHPVYCDTIDPWIRKVFANDMHCV
ncbi:unnamed protein product [Caenorhabditis sp. 36 PRJEB53466]|nr:unnamed protein product [Caenorhabditis sp. 36 PRJEB53466]